MRNVLLLVLLGLLAGCGVSEKEASDTLRGIEAIAGAPADMRPVLLGSLCMESADCPGDCKAVMGTLAAADPKDRMLLLSHCDSSVKPLPETDASKAFDRWIAGRLDAYLKKVRAGLPEADRARLDKAWAAARPAS